MIRENQLLLVHRTAWVMAGWICFIPATIGMLLPIMPTAPFILITAFCFTKVSKRWYRWLSQHKWFGHIVRHSESPKGKRYILNILISTGLTMVYSILFFTTARSFSVKFIIGGSLLIALFLGWTWIRPMATEDTKKGAQ